MSELHEDLGHLPEASKVEALAGFGFSAAEIGRLFDMERWSPQSNSRAFRWT